MTMLKWINHVLTILHHDFNTSIESYIHITQKYGNLFKFVEPKTRIKESKTKKLNLGANNQKRKKYIYIYI